MSKPRDHRAINARRNELARQRGFTGQAQQRRARTEGYGDRPAAYQAAVKTRHAERGITRAVAKGKLLGVGRIRTGTVISGRGSQIAELERAINRFGAGKRISIDIETPAGDVIHLGEHGGYSAKWIAEQGGLAEAIRAMVGYAYKQNVDMSWLDELDDLDEDDDELGDENDPAESDDETGVITVTVV